MVRLGSLLLAFVLVIGMSLAGVGMAVDDHADFADDIAAFVEMTAQMEVDAEKNVYPIIDDTGADSFTPKANLTRFSVKPLIDEALVQDAPLLPKTVPVPVAAQNATLPKVGAVIPMSKVITGVVNFLDGSWLNWLRRWGKNYSAVENVRRAAIWFANKAKAAALTLLGGGRFGVNGPFADLDPIEFRQQYLRATTTIAPRARSFLEQAPAFPNDRRPGEIFMETEADMAAVTENLDFRSSCTPIKTQKECASCWAMAAVSIVESAAFKAGKPLTPLSPQHLVDCNREGNNGCLSGSSANALMYLQSRNSYTEARFPYRNKQNVCSAAKANGGTGPRVKACGLAIPDCDTNGGGACLSQAESSIPERLRMYGPLAAVIDAGLMQFYEGGIINPKSGCLSGWSDMNHAVVIVGYNPTEKYWLMRNSWSASWGESGYFRLAYGQNTCGVANFVFYAVV